MADHRIIQIRDAVALVVTGLSITGSNVFPSRPEEKALAASQLPALWPQLGEEELAEGTLRGSEVEVIDHRLSMFICVRQSGDWEKQLFNIARDVRNAMATNRNAGGALSIEYVASAKPESTGTPEVPAARMEMLFVVKYATPAASVDT
jgi:hypothetical protein